MKKFTYLIALLALTACSNDDNEIQIDNRTPITFSATTGTEVVATPMTKATTPSVDGFDSQTRIVMRIKSHDSSNAKADKFTRTVAKAAPKSSGISSVSFDTDYIRYWDDAHGRNSELSVYAVAIENVSESSHLKDDVLSSGTDTWFVETAENETVVWTLSTTQNSTTLLNENLVFSNNIQPTGTGGRKLQIAGTTENGTLQFEPNGTTGHGKFNQGHMIFNHALTKITVTLTRGDGFSSFNSVKGVVVNANQQGTLDLTNGSWTVSQTNNVEMASVTDKESYSALILPGMKIENGSSTNILEFTIDNNVYYITSDKIWDGINESDRSEALGSNGELLQGKHYVISAKIDKTGINTVSATVVGWTDVNVNNVNPSNAYITLSLYSGGTNPCTSFDLYRLLQTSTDPVIEDSNPDDLKDWSGKYTDKANLTSTENNTFKTNWYFESNTSFYHFRTVNKDEVVSDETTSTFTIKSGFDNSNNAYDPHWGAPMKNENTPSYDPTKGFADCIHSAIGATNSEIKITEFHMLSYVYVQLKSESGESGQKVTLIDATVQLLQLGNEATVDMGSGLISAPSTTNQSQELQLMNDAGTSNKYFSPIVPQALNRTTSSAGTVGIKITTTDGNVYQVENISTYSVSSGETVNRWLPGYKYTYTFNLLKTGINTVTCTVTDWQNVEVNGGNVTIE